MREYKKDNNDLEKNKKKYTLIPEGFEQEYEDYMARKEKEAREKKKQEAQEYNEKFDRKCKAMKEILNGRQKFISEVGTYNVNHDEAYKRAQNKLLTKVIIDYCNDNGISLYKTTESKGKIILKYTDIKGKSVIKEFDKEELLRNVKTQDQQK